MKKILQLCLFLFLSGITFASASMDKGIIILFIRFIPVTSPLEPPPPIQQCMQQSADKMESTTGVAYWALYQLSPPPPRLVTLSDLAPGETIEQYIIRNGASNFVCVVVILIDE